MNTQRGNGFLEITKGNRTFYVTPHRTTFALRDSSGNLVRTSKGLAIFGVTESQVADYVKVNL